MVYIDDHLGDLSNFFDTTNQSLTGSEDTWISSITLKHWRLLDDVESKVRKVEKDVDETERKERQDAKTKAAARRFEKQRKEKRKQKKKPEGEGKTGGKDMEEFRFPPQNVPDQRLYNATWMQQKYGQLSKIHELALSLVITGDEKGRNWTCSIICELFDEEDVAKYASEVAHILQMFIHQQYTGRVLVFLLLLGYICEGLAEECDRFINELDGVMDMNVGGGYNPTQSHSYQDLIEYLCSPGFFSSAWNGRSQISPIKSSSRCSGVSKRCASSVTS